MRHSILIHKVQLPQSIEEDRCKIDQEEIMADTRNLCGYNTNAKNICGAYGNPPTPQRIGIKSQNAT